MKKNTFLIILCIGLFAALIIINDVIPTSKDSFSKIEDQENIIVHRVEQVPPYEKISSMIVGNGMIFLYYDAFGLVNIYSTEGVFQYGIQFATCDNGHGDVAFYDNKLHILTRTNVIYVFEQTKCVEKVEFVNERAKFLRLEERFATPKNNEYAGEIYYLLRDVNQVTKQTAGGQFITLIDIQDKEGFSFFSND